MFMKTRIMKKILENHRTLTNDTPHLLFGADDFFFIVLLTRGAAYCF